MTALGLGEPAFVFSTTNTDRHLGEIAELIAPQGRFALIDDPPTVDINPFKRKSVSVHWELMFTRSIFQTADMGAQGELSERGCPHGRRRYDTHDAWARILDRSTPRT